MAPTTIELARDFALKFIEKSGVRDYEEESVLESIAVSSWILAAFLTGDIGEVYMAITSVGRVQKSVTKTFASAGGDAAITLASLANAAARQSAKIDLGATHGRLWSVKAALEIAATPTAGATVDLYWAPSGSGTAATDNPGGVSGSDAAYAGYSANLVAALKQLQFIGSFVCTAQATGTVQRGFVATFRPPTRYGTLVVVNNSGAAIHSADANCAVVMTSEEDTQEPT